MRLLTHLATLLAGSSTAAAHVAPRQDAAGPPETPTPTVSTCTNSPNATWDQVLGRFPPGSLSATTALPVPALTVDFRLMVDLNPKIALGKGVWGERNWISFKGGQWSATWGNGTVEPGGQDAQLLVENKATFVDTQYLLKTADEKPAYIMVRTQGWRTGPPDVLEKLLDPIEGDKVPASAYRFRLTIKLETGDPRYLWVNEGMWIGSGIRRGSEVIYDGYRLL